MGKVSTSMRSALVLSIASLAVAQQQAGQFSVFGQPRQQPVNIPGTQGQVVAQFIDETGQPMSNSSSSGQHLSSSNLHLRQDHSGPLLTSRTHTRAIFRFISKTLPSSSNSLALSRGKPSVSSKPAHLLHARPSRLHLSPSASSHLLSLSGSSQPLSSSSASSQHRALPRGDPRLPGLRLRRPG